MPKTTSEICDWTCPDVENHVNKLVENRYATLLYVLHDDHELRVRELVEDVIITAQAFGASKVRAKYQKYVDELDSQVFRLKEELEIAYQENHRLRKIVHGSNKL